jgi:opacity protein-like surface antigen
MINRSMKAAGLAGLLCLAGGVAQAQQAPGMYVSGTAGLLILQDQDFSGFGVSGTGEFHPGYSLNGALGYRFGNGLRIEGELGYGRAGVHRLTGNGVRANFSDVDVNLYSATLNAFYDFETGTNFRPYLGAGVGAVHTRQSSGTASVPGVGTFNVGKDDSTDLTVLGEAGVNMVINQSWDLVPSYRFQWVDSSVNGSDDSFAHIVRIGLRYSFGG